MNIIEKIKSFYNKIKLKYQTKNCSITPQGECLIKYIIDRYVNCDDEEEQGRFEEQIANCELLHMTEFQNSSYPTHFIAAITLLRSLLFVANNETKTKWLNYIKDEKRRENFKKSLLHPIIK